MNAALTFAAMIGLVTGVRWLRIAQREHYLAPAVTRFAGRWWMSSVPNLILLLVAIVGLLGVWWNESFGWFALAVAIGPFGLSWRGTTSKLSWTPRLGRLTATAAALCLVGVIASFVTERSGWALISLAGLPLLIDLSLLLISPIEHRLGDRWVTKAVARLRASGARVVAITGSYGKTTTKGYLAHLLAGKMRVVATPASYNNRMGLARTINEQLTPGTDVLIAEMGTYGPGEIAEMCRFVSPEVVMITSIGPVHFERFGSETAIVEAKAEILEGAKVAVLSIDHPLLSSLAERQSSRGGVVRCSTEDASADVVVVDKQVVVSGRPIGVVPDGVFASNVACAVGAALSLGVAEPDMARRLGDLPVAPHRRQVSRAENGVVVIDDTYNSNPAGASEALSTLAEAGVEGRKVVVTPGMVEMGRLQFEANRNLAAQIGAIATDLVVVGKTNRRALLEGARGGRATVTVVGRRPDAVEWVRSQLGPGDAVLYENDLPDHWP